MGGRRAISPDSVVTVSSSQLSGDIPGEAVVLNAETGMYHSMAGVGARIWQCLQDPKTVREIHECLLAEYDIDPETCRADLLSFLNALADQGLIEVREPTTI